jgi:hypothetical protein
MSWCVRFQSGSGLVPVRGWTAVREIPVVWFRSGSGLVPVVVREIPVWFRSGSGLVRVVVCEIPVCGFQSVISAT